MGYSSWGCKRGGHNLASKQQQHFDGFGPIPESILSVTDMGLDTLESSWLKHAVQLGVVGLFDSSFLIDRGLTPCMLAGRNGSRVIEI